jgi:ATP-dependent DNA ligase
MALPPSISSVTTALPTVFPLRRRPIELNGDDLRHDPIESRKATLEMIFAKAGSGIRFNEHLEGDGETVFRHACATGLEGIVSKRNDSAYRSGRSPGWPKMKDANAPAVKRESEEDWRR